MDKLTGVIGGIRRICAQVKSGIPFCELPRKLPSASLFLPKRFNVPERPFPFERGFSLERLRHKTKLSGEAGAFMLLEKSSFNITTVSPFNWLDDAELICGGLFSLAVTRPYDGYKRVDLIFKSSRYVSSMVCTGLVNSLSFFFGAWPCAELYRSDKSGKRVIRVWSTYPNSCIGGITDIIKQAGGDQEFYDRTFSNFVTDTIKLRWLKTMRIKSFPPLKL